MLPNRWAEIAQDDIRRIGRFTQGNIQPLRDKPTGFSPAAQHLQMIRSNLPKRTAKNFWSRHGIIAQKGIRTALIRLCETNAIAAPRVDMNEVFILSRYKRGIPDIDDAPAR